MRKGDRIRESAKAMAWRWGVFLFLFCRGCWDDLTEHLCSKI